MSKNNTRKILLNPGPATTSQGVKEALMVEDICPREREFEKLTRSIMNGLLSVIEADSGKYACVLFAGSGTLAMESVITSFPDKDDEILILSNGAYGKRFSEIAQRYSIKRHVLDIDWNKKIDHASVENILTANSNIKYVYYIHHETTTGIANNITELNKLIHKYKKISVVDAISSFAGIPIYAKRDEIDFIISSSNKCIQGMPGVSFVIGRKDYINNLRHTAKRSYYTDLYDQYSNFEKNNQFRFTPPVQVLYSLQRAINEFFQEGGVERRYKRYSENYDFLKKELKQIGFKFLFNDNVESKILMTVLYPEDAHFDFNVLHDKLYEKGFTIYPGKLRDKENTFRLSVLGDLYLQDISNFIKELRKCLAEMNVNFY